MKQEIVIQRRRQQGFTVLESLIALFVLTIGLMGLAAMQDLSLSKNMDANQLTLATNLATDMLDRIQFNWRNVQLYNNIDTQVGGTQPTQAQASGDYAQWQARLTASGLRNARGLVQVTSIGPSNMQQNQVNVQVTWRGGVLTRTVTMTTAVGIQ